MLHLAAEETGGESGSQSFGKKAFGGKLVTVTIPTEELAKTKCGRQRSRRKERGFFGEDFFLPTPTERGRRKFMESGQFTVQVSAFLSPLVLQPSAEKKILGQVDFPVFPSGGRRVEFIATLNAAAQQAILPRRKGIEEMEG